jgi:enoyl-[acyl-carrier protein] reductase I
MSALIFGVANKWSLAWSIARAWDAAGTPVIMVCRSERERVSVDNLAQTLKHNKQLQAPVLTCDATDDKQLAMVFEQANESFQGELNSVLHGIAAAPPGALGKPFHQLTAKEFLSTQEVSTYSLLAIARHAIPLMALPCSTPSSSPSSPSSATTRSPSITTLSYIGANLVAPGYGVMGVAKASLESSVRYLASELGPQGIRVNCISAPPMKTLSARGIPDFHAMQARAIDGSCLQKPMSPDEIASYATFLASSQASGITGQVVTVDGGFNCML